MALIGVSIALAAFSLFLCRTQAAVVLARLGLLLRSEPETSLKDKPTTLRESPSNVANNTHHDVPSDRSTDMTNPPVQTPRQPQPPTIMTEKVQTTNSISANSPRHQEPNRSDTTLMPPPPRPQPKPPTSLRVPSSGPLPNRGPPTQQRSHLSTSTLNPSNAATASTLPALSRPRKKVILPPGHSPLDWAHKTRTTAPQELSGVPYPQRITPSQLAWATGRKGKPAWSLYKGRVYNITPYLKFHPGGEAELMRAAGRDAQPLFDEVHAWVNWENMLGSCLVGFLVQEEGSSS